MSVSTLASVMIISFIQSETGENMIGKVMSFVMAVGMFASPIGQGFYGIAFEYLLGYESYIILGAVLISFLIIIYTKKIKFD